jgi:predicted alpha/beta superfamily hydrolase
MTKQIGGKTCYIYDCGSSDVLLIQPVDDHDIEVLDSEVGEIKRLSEKGFTLAAFKVDDWNADLSPWEAPPVFGNEAFAGGAEATLKYVTEELIPQITGGKGAEIFIGGYSLAGFFALWAAYQTDLFSGVAAASPSVWFPGWTDYAEANEIKTGKVYLSLGDKEEKTRNPVMRTVGDNIRRQLEILQADAHCEECILEMNQGNHFKEPDIRTAKGFAWLLNEQKK